MDERKNWDHNQTESQEEDMLRQIRGMADDIRVPPALEPDAVEQMLEKRKKEKNRRYRWRYIAGAAAACVCLGVGITGAVLNFGGGSSGSDSAQSTTASESASDNGVAQSRIASAKDYDEIYQYIREERRRSERGTGFFGNGAVAEDSASSADMASGAGSYSGAGTSSAGYSDTNVREEGVGEADIVKTDGGNLYIAGENTVKIVGITDPQMQEYSTIRLDENCYSSELYVQDDKLLILYTKEDYDDGETGYDGYYRNYTCADVYDVSDPESPEKLSSLTQSGSYNTVRIRDGYVYVLSDFYADTAASRSDTWAYIPEVDGAALAASDIYMPQRTLGSEYTVISAFSLDDPGEKTDSKAVFGTAGTCYVSTENIYITEDCYDSDDAGVTQTSIRKIAYQDGKLEGTAQTKVDGTLNDSFSIDEYNGYLRLVTTVTPIDSGGWFRDMVGQTELLESESSNSLYILDGDLQVTGEIHDLAKDESIYSARLMGDVGYFVTFRQIDPLFSVDLSDPYDPEIIGKLKIPGFSEYLHPYGEGKLLGIGMAVDEEGITTEGVKVTMFDISDPSNVKEEHTYVLEDVFGTDVGYDYRAVFVDVEKNLFGFLSYGDNGVYTMFTYDGESGFREVFSRELMWYGSTRGLYAGERFYLISGNTIESFNLSDFEKVDDMVL